MKAGRGNSALHGWENDDYDKTQTRLKELAERLSGRNRPARQEEPERKPKFEEVAKTVLEEAAKKADVSDEDASSVDSRDKRARPSSSKCSRFNLRRGA